MAAENQVSFKESSFGPWRMSSLQGNSMENARRLKTVGTMTDVNAYMSSKFTFEYSNPSVLVGKTSLPDRETGTSRAQTLEDEEKKCGEARLIELATFPGFSSEDYTPLPHGLAPSFIMELVTNAQIRFAATHSFRHTWEAFFTSEPSVCLFLDCFWWFFLHQYHPDQEVQEKLFCRISTNYVKMLLSIEDDCHTKDTLLKVYPDCIAQSIYAAFVHSFPNSWNSFDEQFRSDVCTTLYLWLCGVKPFPNGWEKWNTKALGPKVLDKLKLAAVKESAQQYKVFENFVQQQESAVTPALTGLATREVTMTSDDPVDVTYDRSAACYSQADISSEWKQGREASQSLTSRDTTIHVAINTKQSTVDSKEHHVKPLPQSSQLSVQTQGPEFSHVMFDVCGHSPLVQLYLAQHQLSAKTGYTVLIKRTEVTRLPPDASTYQDVITECTQAEALIYQQFTRLYHRQKEAMQKAEWGRKQAARQHEWEVKEVLSNRRDIQHISNELVGLLGCKDHNPRSAVSAAILKVIKH